MDDDRSSAFYDRFLAPWPLFAGMVVSFATCCALGQYVSHQNPYENFERFHAFINFGSLFYPTAAQVRELGKTHLDRDKIAVVIGGNSVLYGSGQRAEYLWSKKLQALLGDDYRVINLASPGAQVMEFGGVGAEILSREHPRLILVSNVTPGNPLTEPDGVHYRYFFWDAYQRGLLTDDDARDARLIETAGQAKDADKLAEMKLQMRLDAKLAFRDLWTTAAYTRKATIWNPHVAGSFTKARKEYRDPDQGPAIPFAHRHRADLVPVVMHSLRKRIEDGKILTKAGQAAEPSLLQRSVQLACPEQHRRRTLFALVRQCPLYVDQLTSPEKIAYDALFAATAGALEHAGFTALDVGRDYPEVMYYDHIHLGEEGGERLAQDLAPQIRALAKRLGYAGETP